MANMYGIILKHSAITCPSGNKAARETSKKLVSQLPKLAQKHKVKILTAYHFDPDHIIIVTLEGENAESVRDFIFESGMPQWNEVSFHLLTPVDKLVEMEDKIFPAPIF